MVDKEKILAGRKAVDAYREAHHQLHSKPWHRGVPEEHTPLLNIMLKAFKGLGFNTIQEFFDANQKYCLAILDSMRVWLNREDLQLITPIDEKGVRIDVSVHNGETYASLYMDGVNRMNTSKVDHASMYQSIQECPDNARVLVGGLGLGLILLYLAYSGKTMEVIVSEVDGRLINILAERYLGWFASKYPNFKLTIVVGDVRQKVTELGKFDWIFLDTDTPWIEAQFAPYLTTGGRVTIWEPFSARW